MELTFLQDSLLAQIAEKQPVSAARIVFYCPDAMLNLRSMGFIASSLASGPFGVLWSLTKAGAEAGGDTAMPVSCVFCKNILRYKPGGGITDESSTVCEPCGKKHYPHIAERIYSGIGMQE